MCVLRFLLVAMWLNSSDLSHLSSQLQLLSNQTYLDLSPMLDCTDATADENLMTFVNMLGLVTFLSIVAYHFVVSSKEDAEAS